MARSRSSWGLLAALVVSAGLARAQQAAAPSDPDAAVLASLAESSTWTRDEVGDGVWLWQRRLDRLFAGPQSLTVLEITAGAPVRFDVEAPGSLTRTSAMGQRLGALAALNGGFYDTKNGDPVGLLRLDGALRNPANDGQGSFGIGLDGQLQLAVRTRGDWPEVHEALGAGPFLLRDGAVLEHGPKQKDVRHPRTAIGRTADGRVLWLTIDGRTDQAVGTSHEETARILQALGCRDALNLDGGGSSTLWVHGRGVCNFPCDNRRFDHAGERRVANALLLHGAAVVVVDDDDAVLHGVGWQQRQDGERFHRRDFASVGDGAAARAEFVAQLPRAGRWQVLACTPLLAAREGLGVWRVTLPGGESPREHEPAGGGWTDLGTITQQAPGPAVVVLAGVPGKALVVDAVRFVERRPAPAREEPDARDGQR